VHEERVGARGVYVVADGGYEAGQVGRAAGGVEPRLARERAVVEGGPAVRLQRVRIEEGVTLQGNPGQGGVVQRALQDVDVFAVSGEQEHAVVPVDVRDGSAGLRVGRAIGQLEGVPEGFTLVTRPDATGEVQLPRDH